MYMYVLRHYYPVPIQVLTQLLLSVTPCGHACSDEGLHEKFTAAVLKEFHKLRSLYRHIRDEDVPSGSMNRGFLDQLKHRTRNFRPRFECYCGQQITKPPVDCWALLTLASRLQEITVANGNAQVLRPSFACSLSDYFIFYGHFF